MTSPSNYLALTQQLSTSRRGINWFSCGPVPYAKILLTVSLAEWQLAGKDEILHQLDLTYSTWENASLLIANYNRWAEPIAKPGDNGPPFPLWPVASLFLNQGGCPGRISNQAWTDGESRVRRNSGWKRWLDAGRKGGIPAQVYDVGQLLNLSKPRFPYL